MDDPATTSGVHDWPSEQWEREIAQPHGTGRAGWKKETRGPWALVLCLRTNLAICQVSEVAHILHFYLRGLNWAETWQVAKVPEFAQTCIASFYPRGLKLSLFLLYGQRFPRCGKVFKIAIFRHETWQVAIVPDFAHIYPLSTPGVEI